MIYVDYDHGLMCVCYIPFSSFSLNLLCEY